MVSCWQRWDVFRCFTHHWRQSHSGYQLFQLECKENCLDNRRWTVLLALIQIQSNLNWPILLYQILFFYVFIFNVIKSQRGIKNKALEKMFTLVNSSCCPYIKSHEGFHVEFSGKQSFCLVSVLFNKMHFLFHFYFWGLTNAMKTVPPPQKIAKLLFSSIKNTQLFNWLSPG